MLGSGAARLKTAGGVLRGAREETVQCPGGLGRGRRNDSRGTGRTKAAGRWTSRASAGFGAAH
eukprot:4631745-Pyramimonas_sp.AAC.1